MLREQEGSAGNYGPVLGERSQNNSENYRTVGGMNNTYE